MIFSPMVLSEVFSVLQKSLDASTILTTLLELQCALCLTLHHRILLHRQAYVQLYQPDNPRRPRC